MQSAMGNGHQNVSDRERGRTAGRDSAKLEYYFSEQATGGGVQRRNKKHKGLAL